MARERLLLSATHTLHPTTIRHYDSLTHHTVATVPDAAIKERLA